MLVICLPHLKKKKRCGHLGAESGTSSGMGLRVYTVALSGDKSLEVGHVCIVTALMQVGCAGTEVTRAQSPPSRQRNWP